MEFVDLLKQSKITRSELAKSLNITRASISMYTNKKRTPTLETMQKLAEALDVDLQTIVQCFVKETKKDQQE